MTKLNIQRCCRKPNKAKCLLDAVETPLSLLHCHTLRFIGLNHVVKLELSRILFFCNKDYINQQECSMHATANEEA